MIKKIFISSVLSASLLFGAVGEESVLLADILTNSTTQIKKMNDQIKLVTDTIDQIDKVNNVLNKIDYLIFESGEKIFNPKATLDKIVGKMQRLKQRFENYPEKFKNGFGYDRFFKDYHNLTCRAEWSGDEIKEFEEIKKQTGIEIEELKIRKCIEENLVKARSEQDKEDLLKISEYVKNRDYEGAVKHLEKQRIKRIAKEMSRNAEIMNSARMLNDVFLDYNSKNEQGQTEIQVIRKNIENITDEILNNSSPDLQGSLSTLNALMLDLVSLTEKMYSAQVAYYKAYSNFQVAIYGKKAVSKKQLENYKKNGEQTKTKPFYEEILENPSNIKYDVLGLPIF